MLAKTRMPAEVQSEHQHRGDGGVQVPLNVSNGVFNKLIFTHNHLQGLMVAIILDWRPEKSLKNLEKSELAKIK